MQFRRLSVSIVAIAFFLTFAAPAAPAQTPGATASITGVTSSQHGDVLLPGVLVSLIDNATGAAVATASSDENGAFTFPDVAPGAYSVRGTLAEFQDTTSGVLQVRAGQTVRASIDLPVSSIVEHINVTPQPTNLAATTALPAESVRVDDIRTFEPVSTSDVGNVLALMPGAVHGPGGGPVTINGGRPTQTRVLVDGMAIVDPITGRADIDLPTEAIDAVQILPNPAGGDYGRLSAGVIQFRTREGVHAFRFSVANFVPEPLFRQGGVHGIRDFSPRVFAGGPLVKDRVFIAESLLVERYVPRVYGVEETAATETTRTRVTSFTRLDAVLSKHQTATLAFDASPRNIDQIGVGRFQTTSAAASQRVRPFFLAGSERATLGQRTTVESNLAARSFSTDVNGDGTADMVISPDGRSGNFFNTQHREFQTLQWKETLTASGSNRTGAHLLKIGTDVLYGTYSGTDVSRPIDLERADGTLAERVDFTRPAVEQANGTDAAIFAGDSWAPWPRVKIEPSIRIERDAAIHQTNVSPRASLSVGVTSNGSGVLHAGMGRFFERTPLLTTTFGAFEPQTLTRYDTSGQIQIGAPVVWTPAVASALQSPSSFIWNAGYEHRFNAMWQVAANVLERRGANDFIVSPVAATPTSGSLLLSSTGRSRYREMSLWGEFQRGSVHTSASYVWSSARGDLNSLDQFYGTFRNPVLQTNEYGPTSLDVPHRLVAWTSVPGPWGFGFSDVTEIRSGFPYSPVDVYQQYAGPANSLRYPDVFTTDLTIFHNVKIGSHIVRLLVRTYNLFDRFNPLEVQNNVTAADFGTFYSHVERRIALDFDLIH